MIIQANVIDISKDKPQKTDSFIIDTNALIWTTYAKSLYDAEEYQTRVYPEYIDKIIESGATIYTTSFNLLEISHVIEKIEFELFKLKASKSNLSLKRFRHQGDMSEVKQDICSSWEQIQQFSTNLDINLDNKFNSEILNLIASENVDGYDRALLFAALTKNLRVLSDDKDIASVKGITLHTAQSNTIRSSLEQHKLLPFRV